MLRYSHTYRFFISIHALLAESDCDVCICRLCCIEFLSTLSLRRATFVIKNRTAFSVFLSTLSLRRATCDGRPQSGWTNISIHALLAESDLRVGKPPANSLYFYPRSPCGERPRSTGCPGRPRHFYPRSPCGERLKYCLHAAHLLIISIHALLAESDPPVTRRARNLSNFYPRSPCGERLHNAGPWQGEYTDFYPRSPCGERLCLIIFASTCS